jgi:hypothetical protein
MSRSWIAIRRRYSIRRDRHEILEAWRAGESQANIARRLSVTGSRVGQIIQKYGEVDPPPVVTDLGDHERGLLERRFPKMARSTDAEFSALLAQHSFSEVCEWNGFGPVTARRIFECFGLPIVEDNKQNIAFARRALIVEGQIERTKRRIEVETDRLREQKRELNQLREKKT